MMTRTWASIGLGAGIVRKVYWREIYYLQYGLLLPCNKDIEELVWQATAVCKFHKLGITSNRTQVNIFPLLVFTWNYIKLGSDGWDGEHTWNVQIPHNAKLIVTSFCSIFCSIEVNIFCWYLANAKLKRATIDLHKFWAFSVSEVLLMIATWTLSSIVYW